MSYILDALRKVERQRQRAARVPTLDTVHQPALTPLRRWWPWAIAAVLALNAAVLVVVLHPDSSVVAPPTVEPRRDLPPRELAGSVAPEATQRSPDRPGERSPARAAPSAPPTTPLATAAAVPTPTESPAVTRVEPDRSRESSTVPPPQPPVPPARAVSPPPAAVAGPRPSEGAPAAETADRPPGPAKPAEQPSAAPAARPPGSAPAEAAARGAEPAAPAGSGSADAASVLRDAMSKMSLDVLVYAEREADRFVFISGRKYVEGQRVDEKFLLEAILEEGAILSDGGQRLLLRPRLNPSPPSTRRGVGR